MLFYIRSTCPVKSFKIPSDKYILLVLVAQSFQLFLTLWIVAQKAPL